MDDFLGINQADEVCLLILFDLFGSNGQWTHIVSQHISKQALLLPVSQSLPDI